MYFRNCGSAISNNAYVCIKCGVAAGTGFSYCPHCGNRTNPQAVICTNCGIDFQRYLKQYNTAQYGDQKSKIAAGLFGIFLGALGIHNFYLGYTGKAIAQLLITILSFGLLSWVSFTWGLIEGILILAGSINRDKNGVPLKD